MTNSPNPIMRMAYAAVISVGFIGALSAMIFRSIPDGNGDALGIMIGYLGGQLLVVGAWYFGATKE